MLISNAYAQVAPAAGGSESSLLSFLPLLLMMVVLYFLMIRPQMKRQKEQRLMLEALKVGDEVITVGGLLGTLTKVGEQYLTLEISHAKDGAVVIQLQKSAVQTVLPKGTIKAL